MLKVAVLGAVWLSIGQWLVRLLGVISLVILARYLSATDYGIMAMINISVSFLDAILVLGTGQFIVAKVNLTEDDKNTAWTINAFKMAFLFTVLFLLAPFIADFYDTPEIELPTQLIAFSILIGALENISPDLLRKELKFNRVVLFNIVPKLVGTIANIAFAVIYQSYWALVAGTILMKIASVIVSYLIHPFRPKFSLVSHLEIWAFTKLSLISNFAIFIKNRLDTILIGKFYSSEFLGNYTMAQTVASLPSTEITTPLIGGIIPSLSKIRQVREDYIKNVKHGLQLISIVVWPCCFGLLTIAPEFIDLVLSQKWQTILNYLYIVTIILSVDVIAAYCKNVLILEGLLKYSVKCEWLLAAFYGISFSIAMYYSDIQMMLQFKLAGSCIFLFALLYKLCKKINRVFIKTSRLIISPFVIGAIVYWGVNNLSVLANFDNKTSVLLLKFGLWMAFYPFGIMLVWHLIGKKETVEKIIFEKLTVFLSR
jgi:O-antigen/teichoic acid export membrane protein